MSDYGSGDDLFEGAEAGAILDLAASSQPATPAKPVKRKFEDEDDEFDELLAGGLSDLDKPPAKRKGAPAPHKTELARKILRQTFGYDGFRLEQEAAISSILHGRSAMVVMPTGGGKSLCYQVPAIAFPELDKAEGAARPGGHGITIVVSPLLALMRDQVEVLKRKGVAADSIDSTKTWEQQQEISAKMRNGTLRLLYCAPERLNNEGFIENIKHVAGGIRLVAVDEAHCISEWGHQFRPDYLKVARFVHEVKAERAICLTATATSNVIDDVCKAFDIAKTDVFRTAPYRPNLRLLAKSVAVAEDKLPELLDFLKQHKGPTLVYVTAQQQTVELANKLRRAKLRAVSFHAGMKTEDKEAAQDQFMADEVEIVVATIAFGMGIDKPNIRNVVHYCIPGSVEEYSQQVGRAGRDGKPSTCIFFLCPEDLDVRDVFTYGDTPTRAAVVSVLQDIFSPETVALPVNGVFKRSQYAQTNEHDIRANPLSVMYAMLELRFGLIRAVTPEYGQYKFKPERAYEAVIAADKSAAARAVQDFSSKGRGAQYTMDVQVAARSMDLNRQEIIRKLNGLHDRGIIKLTASGMENRYRITTKDLPDTPAKIESLADDIFADLKQREAEAVRRTGQVIGLVTGEQCFAHALSVHFDMGMPGGKERCGHCGFCETGVAVAMPAPPARLQVDKNLLAAVLAAVPDRDDPLLLTKIAFGITTPRVTRMKISRNSVFGSLVGHKFDEVLAEFTRICSQGGQAPGPASAYSGRPAQTPSVRGRGRARGRGRD